jgi:hypothetical protein
MQPTQGARQRLREMERISAYRKKVLNSKGMVRKGEEKEQEETHRFEASAMVVDSEQQRQKRCS